MNSEEKFEQICCELGLSPSSPEASAAEAAYNIAIKDAINIIERCSSVTTDKTDFFLMVHTKVDQLEIV
jgi:hypothetical protein